MTDLEYRIHTRIDWAYEDPHIFGERAFDALRAVLDDATAFEAAGNWSAAHRIRTTIARALEVEQ